MDSEGDGQNFNIVDVKGLDEELLALNAEFEAVLDYNSSDDESDLDDGGKDHSILDNEKDMTLVDHVAHANTLSDLMYDVDDCLRNKAKASKDITHIIIDAPKWLNLPESSKVEDMTSDLHIGSSSSSSTTSSSRVNGYNNYNHEHWLHSPCNIDTVHNDNYSDVDIDDGDSPADEPFKLYLIGE